MRYQWRGLAIAASTTLAAALVGATPAHADPPLPGPNVGPGPRTVQLNQQITDRVQARLRHYALGSNVSATVIDTATGRVLVARNASKPMVGASNTKLLTGALAIKRLGADHRLVTRVVRVGPRSIAIVGAGDQLLSSQDLKKLAKRTARALGPKSKARITVRLDDYLYQWRGPAPGWVAQEVSDYGPGPIRSLNRDDRRSADGAAEAARYFTARLAAAGVRAVYGGRYRTKKPSPVLAATDGHTVAQLARASLWPSDSDFAEALARLLAFGSGQRTTWPGVNRAALATLREIGVPTEGIVLHDGSGLSHRNRLTTMTMARMLDVGLRDDQMRTLVTRRLMATAGYNGTLSVQAGRFTAASNRCAQGRVFAKTGTLGGVVALSGYAMGTDGRWKVFSFMVNDRPAVPLAVSRQALDDLAATVVGCH